MKKLLLVAILGFLSMPALRAEPSPGISGVYQELMLGADPEQEIVTGFFKIVDEPPNMPHQECSFYFSGKWRDGKYSIQARSPGDKKSTIVEGQLSFFSTDNNKPSALLRLEKLDRDCSALKPNLAKGQGAFFDLKKGGAWTQVRMVGASKSPYYQAPDTSSPTRDSAKRGTVLTVMERRADWVQVQSEQKSKGWIREADLYPISPSLESAEPSLPALDQVPATTKQPVVKNQPPTNLQPEIESQDLLLARLKVIDAQSFEMALQVLKDPTKRKALSTKRMEMEKDFRSLVTKLKKSSPAAYTNESKEIFETWLDLQYIERDQPVISLRLNQRIQ